MFPLCAQISQNHTHTFLHDLIRYELNIWQPPGPTWVPGSCHFSGNDLCQISHVHLRSNFPTLGLKQGMPHWVQPSGWRNPGPRHSPPTHSMELPWGHKTERKFQRCLQRKAKAVDMLRGENLVHHNWWVATRSRSFQWAEKTLLWVPMKIFFRLSIQREGKVYQFPLY